MKKAVPATLLAGILLTGCVSTSADRLQQVESDRSDSKSMGLPSLGDDSALRDYLQYAALNNPGLEAAFNEWQAAVEAISQSRSLPDPRLSYATYIEEVETRVGPQRQKFEVSQMFPWFGTLGLKGDMANEAAEAAYQRYEAAKLKLFYRVKQSYYETYYLSRAIRITERNIKLVSELEGVARAKFKTSAVKHAAVVKAQVELGRLEDRLRALQDFRSPLSAKLNAALNRPLKEALPPPTELPAVELRLSGEEILEAVRASSPDLQALRHAAARAAFGVGIARKNAYPDFMLGVGLIETGDSDIAGIADSGKDPIVAMLGISLPVWQGKYRAEMRQAKAREAAAGQRLVDRENTLLADVELALYHFRDADRKIALYRKGLIPKARESLQVNRQAFESGKATFLDVIDAERDLLEFELSYERAQVNRAQRLAELEMLVGKELSITSDRTEKGKEMKTTAAIVTTALVLGATAPAEAAKKAPELKPQTVCPVMGGKINKDLYLDHKGQRIYVCCAGCLAPIKKDPAKYIKKMAEKGEAPTKIQTVCPVMGGKINKDHFAEHDGKRIYVCCPPCIAKIKADPDKYVKKMKDAGITLDEIPKKK